MTALLKELGIRADVEKLNTLIPCLKGKKLHELIAAGMGKLQAVASAPGIYIYIYIYLYIIYHINTRSSRTEKSRRGSGRRGPRRRSSGKRGSGCEHWNIWG